MATNTSSLGLLQTLPDSLNTDPDVASISLGLDPEFNDVAGDLPQLKIITNIANLPDATLDYLAFQFAVDFYDPTFPTATKAYLIESNLYFQSLKGTPGIIQNLITQVISSAQVLEWYQYGGKPYHFRVNTASTITGTPLAQALNLVMVLKNLRSWFDGFATLVTLTTPGYVASGVFTSRTFSLPIAR